MKRQLILVVSFLMLCTLLLGCQPNQNKNEVNSNEVNINELLKFKNSFVGDNNALTNIMNNSPGSDYLEVLSLQTKKPPYGMTVEYGPKMSGFEKFWSLENTKRIFLMNATTLFVLVKNVDSIQIIVDTKEKRTFTISRKELETFYGKDLRTYAKHPSAWKKEIFDSVGNNSDKIDAFFESHPIAVK